MYIFDIEGTLTDSKHREWTLEKEWPSGVNKWDEFHKYFPDDPPRKNIIFLNNICSMNRKTILLTGMMEKHRAMALNWLSLNGVKYDHLEMRPNDNFEPSKVFKLNYIKKLTDPVSMVFDDRSDIVSHLLENGIPTIQV